MIIKGYSYVYYSNILSDALHNHGVAEALGGILREKFRALSDLRDILDFEFFYSRRAALFV